MSTFLPGLLVVAGAALFVYGGYDDSPGAQGLGLLIAAYGAWRIFVAMKRNRTAHR